MKKNLITVTCALTLLFGASSSFAEDKSVSIVADAALVRPGCFAATVVGSAVFVLILPVAAMSKSVKKTADALVVYPAKATFTRPMGDFTGLQ